MRNGFSFRDVIILTKSYLPSIKTPLTRGKSFQLWPLWAIVLYYHPGPNYHTITGQLPHQMEAYLHHLRRGVFTSMWQCMKSQSTFTSKSNSSQPCWCFTPINANRWLTSLPSWSFHIHKYSMAEMALTVTIHSSGTTSFVCHSKNLLKYFH